MQSLIRTIWVFEIQYMFKCIERIYKGSTDEVYTPCFGEVGYNWKIITGYNKKVDHNHKIMHYFNSV